MSNCFVLDRLFEIEKLSYKDYRKITQKPKRKKK